MKTRFRSGVAVTLTFVVAVLALGPASSSSAPGDNAVVHWSEVAESAISAGRPPASATVLAAMVHGAMYDAAAAIAGDLEPFATGVKAPPGTSLDAAVAQAARDVLVARVPGQAPAVQNAYDAYMAAIPAGLAKDGGRAVGAAAAAGMLAWRTGDRFDVDVPYVQPAPGPGVFEPIAPTTPVDVKLGNVRPFTFASQSAYRPGPPYALASVEYGADVVEVQAVGRLTSTSRTAAQADTARFYTENPYVQYNRALRQIANGRGLDVSESARLFAYVWTATADTQIACWEAKYHYLFWRPDHAIQRADTDGNPATSPEAGWRPLVVGNHPEYPSGHGCITAAFTTSLERYFGTRDLPLVITSTVTGGTRSYARLDDLVADVVNARVWGGLHFRWTMTETMRHFAQIARDVGREYFLDDRTPRRRVR